MMPQLDIAAVRQRVRQVACASLLRITPDRIMRNRTSSKSSMTLIQHYLQFHFKPSPNRNVARVVAASKNEKRP
jgi:hypothetical protein